jgi:hypothetical protein
LDEEEQLAALQPVSSGAGSPVADAMVITRGLGGARREAAGGEHGAARTPSRRAFDGVVEPRAVGRVPGWEEHEPRDGVGDAALSLMGQGHSGHPAPPRRRGHGGDQLATLKRTQPYVQRSGTELELRRELRGLDAARVAGRDHIERRLLARGELIGGIAGQRSP